MIIPATFALGACVLTVQIENGYFIEGQYTNPYPFPLNFQVVDTEPDVGETFTYSYVLEPFSTDASIEFKARRTVYNMFGRIMFVKG